MSSTFDASRVSTSDAVVALRSYPRRFRAAVVVLRGDPVTEAMAERVGPAGRSALECVVCTTNTWVLLERALEQVLTLDDAVLHPAVRDESARSWETPPGTTVEDALQRLADEAESLADRIAHVSLSDLKREATVAGDGRVHALDVIQEAVRVGHDQLAAAAAAFTAARNTPA